MEAALPPTSFATVLALLLGEKAAPRVREAAANFFRKRAAVGGSKSVETLEPALSAVACSATTTTLATLLSVAAATVAASAAAAAALCALGALDASLAAPCVAAATVNGAASLNLSLWGWHCEFCCCTHYRDVCCTSCSTRYRPSTCRFTSLSCTMAAIGTSELSRDKTLGVALVGDAVCEMTRAVEAARGAITRSAWETVGLARSGPGAADALPPPPPPPPAPLPRVAFVFKNKKKEGITTTTTTPPHLILRKVYC